VGRKRCFVTFCHVRGRIHIADEEPGRVIDRPPRPVLPLLAWQEHLHVLACLARTRPSCLLSQGAWLRPVVSECGCHRASSIGGAGAGISPTVGVCSYQAYLPFGGRRLLISSVDAPLPRHAGFAPRRPAPCVVK